MTAALEEDSDPLLTHFAHRDEFFELFGRFIKVDVGVEPSTKEDADEEGCLKSMGWIVSPARISTSIIKSSPVGAAL